ncbi:hypothetical protein RIR_jg23504.t2 [Rhizophagus irregularis DAOM 181602=DAOM 197198]|nr:hypothetical protein RIR_jg23504.t2 [Rhizophagus irregularis DAOM 181602=DAOM 197198]
MANSAHYKPWKKPWKRKQSSPDIAIYISPNIVLSPDVDIYMRALDAITICEDVYLNKVKATRNIPNSIDWLQLKYSPFGLIFRSITQAILMTSYPHAKRCTVYDCQTLRRSFWTTIILSFTVMESLGGGCGRVPAKDTIENLERDFGKGQVQ